jgi:hypothetical protein
MYFSKLTRLFCFFIFAFSAVFSSCSKKTSVDELVSLTEEIKTTADNISWYYFTKDSVFKTDSLENTPKTGFKTWQDAVRVTDSFQTENDSFMLVNKSGILYLNQNEPELITDSSIFKENSAGTFIQCRQIPVFNIYKNNFFTVENDNSPEGPEQIIYQFRKETKTFYPVISKTELKLSPVQEISSFIKKDNLIYAMTRDTSGEKIKYAYFSFSDEYLLFKTNGNAKAVQLQKEKENQENYRQLLTPVPFTEAPKRIRSLLGRVPASCSFIVKIKSTTDNVYPQYINEAADTDHQIIECKILLAQNYSIAVFEDGTTFFSGSLPDKYIISNGEPCAFRLPKLLPEFVYTDIAVAGNKLYVAWEEDNFYETARSGFLEVQLENILY